MSVDSRYASVDIATFGPTVGLYYNFVINNVVQCINLNAYKKAFGDISTSPAKS